MSRAMLAEQLYRAFAILASHASPQLSAAIAE